MKKKFLVGLAIGFFLLGLGASAMGATISYFNDPIYVDTSRESINERAELINLGHTVIDFTGTSAANWASAMTAGDAIVIPEPESGLLNAALSSVYTDIGSWIFNGGGLIISGTHSSDEVDLLNSIFGYSLVNGGGFASGSSSLNASDAAGTPFAGGPATLSNVNGTFYVGTASLPTGALNLYSSADGTSVFAAQYGAGGLVYLGYDWYDSVQPSGWGVVLDSAIDFATSGTAPIPEPSTMLLLGVGLLGLAGVGRKNLKK